MNWWPNDARWVAQSCNFYRFSSNTFTSVALTSLKTSSLGFRGAPSPDLLGFVEAPTVMSGSTEPDPHLTEEELARKEAVRTEQYAVEWDPKIATTVSLAILSAFVWSMRWLYCHRWARGANEGEEGGER